MNWIWMIAAFAITITVGAQSEFSYNLALSARVVTSDPNRIDGAKARRLDEFPAADVFLTQPLQATKDGTYTVPANGCIGLEWAERRVLTSLWIHFAPNSKIAGESIGVQYWSSEGRRDDWATIGQTPWQGKWLPFPALQMYSRDALNLAVWNSGVPEFQDGQGTLRIRFLLPKRERPIVVTRLGALSPSEWKTTTLCLDTDPPNAKWSISAYNGEVDASDPHSLKVLYSVPSTRKADRTSLRFSSRAGGFAVAVEDVLANDGVYVKNYGVFLASASSGMTMDAYRRKHAKEKTILQRVRDMPDQTFEQAMKELWRPIQNNGPTLLSLAADNRKFIVQRTGDVVFKTTEPQLQITPNLARQQMRVDRMDFGSLGVDTAVVPPFGSKPMPLRIKDRVYQKGLGIHANSSLTVQLDGSHGAFESEVGMLQQGNNIGAVTFQVWVDGVKRAEVGPMNQSDAARPINVPLAGARSMTLRATTGPDIHSAAGNWAEARLTSTNGHSLFLSDLYAADRKKWTVSRQLNGGWLPIPVTTIENSGARYDQRTFVVPLDKPESQVVFVSRKPLCVIEYSISNTLAEPKDISLILNFFSPRKPAIKYQRNEKQVFVRSGDNLSAWIDLKQSSPLQASAELDFQLNGRLPAHGCAKCVVFVPGWDASPDEAHQIIDVNRLRNEVEAYWTRILGKAMQVETPEPLLDNFIKSTQVHCLMAGRNEDGGKRIAPSVAADAYGPLDTEAQAVILGMDEFGHSDFARRCHEFFVHNYNADGLLTRSYTLMGTGQHLWTLARHYELTRDDAWLANLAPELVRPCDWIARQCEKTKQLDRNGERLPESGLVPPGVLADWDRYAYYMYANAHYCAGVRDVAKALGCINHPRAAEFRKTASRYEKDILRAYEWNQARMPVIPLRNATWVPPTVSSLYCFGLTRDFYSGVSATGHDVEVGGNHLIPLGLIPPHSRQAEWIADYLEDRWFLIDGIFNAYPAAENERDWFNRGGFAKLQPHYARTTEIHALRDDVKSFIRTYFNTFPILLNRENLTYWEHMNNGGAWDKTHESGWFLDMTRTMLVQERGDELWLAPFVTDNWLKDGMKVVVQNAPTFFGPLSYEIESHAATRTIIATIEPPTRTEPKQIVLRLRHPDGKQIRKVTLNGKKHKDFDSAKNTIRFSATKDKTVVQASY